MSDDTVFTVTVYHIIMYTNSNPLEYVVLRLPIMSCLHRSLSVIINTNLIVFIGICLQ